MALSHSKLSAKLSVRSGKHDRPHDIPITQSPSPAHLNEFGMGFSYADCL